MLVGILVPHRPAHLLGRLWLWGCWHGCHCCLWALLIIPQALGVFWGFRCCWAVICWVLAIVCRLLPSLGAVIEVLGGVVCGGVGRVMWHAGDMEGTRIVVDIGDVAM